jgi:hypothetical protein
MEIKIKMMMMCFSRVINVLLVEFYNSSDTSYVLSTVYGCSFSSFANRLHQVFTLFLLSKHFITTETVSLSLLWISLHHLHGGVPSSACSILYKLLPITKTCFLSDNRKVQRRERRSACVYIYIHATTMSGYRHICCNWIMLDVYDIH